MKKRQTMERGHLWKAIKSNNLALVKQLIGKGVYINSVSRDLEKTLCQITDVGASQVFKPRIGTERDHKVCGSWEESTLHNSDQNSNLDIDEKEKTVSDEKVEQMTKKKAKRVIR